MIVHIAWADRLSTILVRTASLVALVVPAVAGVEVVGISSRLLSSVYQVPLEVVV